MRFVFVQKEVFCVYLLIRVIRAIRVRLRKTIFRVLIKTYVRLTLNNPCESCFSSLNVKITCLQIYTTKYLSISYFLATFAPV